MLYSTVQCYGDVFELIFLEFFFNLRNKWYGHGRTGRTASCGLDARVMTNSEELWILRLTKPSALFALEVTVAMCLFQIRSDVIVIPRYLADLTFSRASLWSLYGNLIGHFFASNREAYCRCLHVVD